MLRRISLGVPVVVAGLAICRWAGAESSAPVQVELNGLRVSIGSDSGGVLQLEFDGMTMLRTSHENASLLDAAYPGHGFEPLRIGVRHSSGARIEQADRGISITWDALGLSRDLKHEGAVAATVLLQPAEDGRSVVLKASIENRSPIRIPQVLFPDFAGLQPFAGEDGTELRTCGFAKKPFRELKPTEDEGRWYASRRNWLELTSGAYDKSMAARWMDLGSLKGGFSLFPKLWSWGPLHDAGKPTTDRVLLHLSQVDGSLRLMCEHKVNIQPGETWISPEYVLTPHRYGWAKGIEPFRAWVKENVQRPYPLPRHLRESLGYRTVWMAQQYANADPAEPTVAWRFGDLTGLAEECREHGLREMVLWLWQPWEIPIEPSPELGSLEEFNQAIRECREKEVNVSLFVSVMTLLNPLPAQYGWNTGTEYWGYHTDFIPMLRPYYGQASRGAFADQTDPRWQADITASLLRMVERGWTSITWDQALHVPTEPNIGTVFAKVRTAAKERDSEATFAGEDINNLDLDSRWLDYTWNWALFSEDLDWRALVNAYPTTRFNVNVGTSPRTVKRLFVDHLFMNVLPSKPEGINGSARIQDFPKLSEALKSCARLHAKFRNYLEEGLLIGDCVLSEPCAGARINCYLLPDRALILVLNTGGQNNPITFACDLSPWLTTSSGKYSVIPYDESGSTGAYGVDVAAAWRQTTPALRPDEIAVYEIAPL
jgi:hypothetical protein